MGATLARLRSAVRTAGVTGMHCHLASLQSLYAAYTGDIHGARGWMDQLAGTLPKDEWTFQRTLFAVWDPLMLSAPDPIFAHKLAMPFASATVIKSAAHCSRSLNHASPVTALAFG